MKDIALQIASEAKEQKLNVLREYLQNYILFLMHKSNMSTSLFFLGGTALRFLYKLKRYSEDLDFSAGDEWRAQDILKYTKKIESSLEKSGYLCTFHFKEEKTVQKYMIRFSELLYDAGLTDRKSQKFPIHIEIDTNPPSGWIGKKTIVDIHMPVLLQHYDLPSLFGGKLAAVLTRSYTKGRDLYDIFWFLSKWKEMLPNFKLLNNAIAQNHPSFVRLNEDNWLEIVLKKVQSLRWETVENDVIPFLEYRDLDIFSKENLILLLSQ